MTYDEMIAGHKACLKHPELNSNLWLGFPPKVGWEVSFPLLGRKVSIETPQIFAGINEEALATINDWLEYLNDNKG